MVHQKDVGVDKGGFCKFYTVSIVLLPIINQYKVFPLTNSDVFIIMVIALYVVQNGILINENIVFYSIYLFISTLVLSASYGMSISALLLKMFRLVFSILVFYIVGEECIDFEIGFKVYQKIIFLITVLVFVQYFLFVAMGVRTSFLIPNMLLNYSGGTNSNELIRKMEIMKNYRPASLFIEPAHQAEYMLPWIGYTLFSKRQKRNNLVFQAAIVSFALLLGASVTSIVCCAVIWLVYMLYLLKESGYDMRNFGILLLLILVIFLAVSYLMTIPSIQQQITGKINSANNADSTSSFTLRVMRGWYCFAEMDILHQIFGCGYHSFEYYYKYSGMTTKYDTNLTIVSYMSGWFSALCNLGIVGFISYLMYLIPMMWKNTYLSEKMMFAVLVMMMFGSDLFETPVCILVILMVIGSKKRRGALYA